jgi:hypothetical protein
MSGFGSLGDRQHRPRGLSRARTAGHTPMDEFVRSLDDARHLRFTISPPCETIRLARSIAQSDLHRRPRRVWLRRRRRSVEGSCATPSCARSLPSSPPQGTTTPTSSRRPPPGLSQIQVELAQIRATPTPRVEQEIGRCLERARAVDSASERLLRSSNAAGSLAGQLEALWDALVAPSGPQLRGLLERDILYRSRVLAQGGLAGLFADLEPFITLRKQRLVVALDTDGTLARVPHRCFPVRKT